MYNSKIFPPAELNRLAERRRSSTHSSSPGTSVAGSSAGIEGSLSPPPPSHYLRDRSKSHSVGPRDAVELLRKRSELYERARRSDKSATSSPRQEVSRLVDLPQSRSSSSNPSLHGQMQAQISGESPKGSAEGPLPFLATHSAAATMSKSVPNNIFALSRNKSSAENSTAEGVLFWEPSSNPASRRGSLRGRDAHEFSYRRRSKDSLLSVSSNTSSSHFPSSLDPHTSTGLPTESTSLGPSFPKNALSLPIRAHDCTPRHCKCDKSFRTPHESTNTLFDVQKRRRVQAFDQFTSYTETLPFHRQPPRSPNSACDGATCRTEDKETSPYRSESTVHLSAPWDEQESDEGVSRSSTPPDGAPDASRRRKQHMSYKMLNGVKGLLSPKGRPLPD